MPPKRQAASTTATKASTNKRKAAEISRNNCDSELDDDTCRDSSAENEVEDPSVRFSAMLATMMKNAQARRQRLKKSVEAKYKAAQDEVEDKWTQKMEEMVGATQTRQQAYLGSLSALLTRRNQIVIQILELSQQHENAHDHILEEGVKTYGIGMKNLAATGKNNLGAFEAADLTVLKVD